MLDSCWFPSPIGWQLFAVPIVLLPLFMLHCSRADNDDLAGSATREQSGCETPASRWCELCTKVGEDINQDRGARKTPHRLLTLAWESHEKHTSDCLATQGAVFPCHMGVEAGTYNGTIATVNASVSLYGFDRYCKKHNKHTHTRACMRARTHTHTKYSSAHV